MKVLDEGVNNRRRKLMGRATFIFLGVMLLLTFFSNTLNNFSLPKVTYEAPSSGALIKEVTGTGKTEAKSYYDLYANSSMRVTDVMVKVGDSVKQGQTLLTLDTTDIESQLKDERDRCEQKKLNLEKLIEAGDKLKEAQTPGNLLNLDKAVETARQNLDKTKKNYEDSQSLFDVGGISASELSDAKSSYEIAQIDYEIAKNNREKEVKDTSRDIDNNSRDIESTRLDISMSERKIAELADEMNLKKVTAPCNGMVTELNFSKGMTANSSQPLYKIADSKGGFQFTATVDIAAAEYLEQGDAADVTLNTSNSSVIKGKVSEIKDNQQQIGEKKDVVIDIESENLIGGESGTVDIKKNMGSFNTLVSNSAIGQNNDGYFVYVVKERKGMLGNEFYVEKVTVTIGDSDNIKTAVLSGLYPNDKVVSDSDKSLSDGMRVMLAE